MDEYVLHKQKQSTVRGAVGRGAMAPWPANFNSFSRAFLEPRALFRPSARLSSPGAMLPIDVVETLLIVADSPDLACRIASVSKLCKRASESDLVWRHLCKTCFPPAVVRHARPGISWRAFFKSRCVVQKWKFNGTMWLRSAVVVRIKPPRRKPHVHPTGSVPTVSGSAS